MFRNLKEFRRIATRYDKLIKTFMGFVKLGARVNINNSKGKYVIEKATSENDSGADCKLQ